MVAKCSSVDELLKSAKAIPRQLKPRSRGVSLLDGLERFTERLKPYFDVIGIIVQSNPEFSAIAWGAVRLVLQVGLRPLSLIMEFILTKS